MIWYEHHVFSFSTVMVDHFGECIGCGGLTNSIDVCFEGFLHQGECSHDYERSYWLAVAA